CFRCGGFVSAKSVRRAPCAGGRQTPPRVVSFCQNLRSTLRSPPRKRGPVARLERSDIRGRRRSLLDPSRISLALHPGCKLLPRVKRKSAPVSALGQGIALVPLFFRPLRRGGRRADKALPGLLQAGMVWA